MINAQPRRVVSTVSVICAARSVLPVLPSRIGDVDAQQHRPVQSDEGAREGERKCRRREVPPSGHGHQTGQTDHPGANVDGEDGDREQATEIPTGLCRMRIPTKPKTAGKH
jgi:hypothetical protein